MNIKFKVWVKEAFHYEQRPVALYGPEEGFIGRYTEHELTLLGFHMMVSVRVKDVIESDNGQWPKEVLDKLMASREKIESRKKIIAAIEEEINSQYE